MIKKLDRMLLKSFLKVFSIILVVVLFVMYTQNTVNWAAGIAGKNLGFFTYLKLITYLIAISASLVGYPITTLLASVINMKELVESREIIAMKSAGISEPRILMPLIIFKILMVILMYFGNAFMTPETNKRLFLLIHKIKKTNPILDIKEGVFYNELEGYSIKINKKFSDEKTIEDIIIYDHTEKKGNVLVTMAKSGELYSTPNEKYLILKLYNGYSYIEKGKIEDKENTENLSKFLRSTFEKQKIILNMDELGEISKELFKDQVYNKNAIELESEIKVMKHKIEDIKTSELSIIGDPENLINMISEESYENLDLSDTDIENLRNEGALFKYLTKNYDQEEANKIIDFSSEKIFMINKILEEQVPKIIKLQKKIRRYRVQHLSYILQAILVILMLILGASLGLMSRKGEIKIQSLIFVSLFLIYYFLVYKGINLAEEGYLEPIFAISLPFLFVTLLTIFFARKALRGDSIRFDDFKYFFISNYKYIFGKTKKQKLQTKK